MPVILSSYLHNNATNYDMTQHHIPALQSPQQHRCENLKVCAALRHSDHRTAYLIHNEP